jgi:hypothetical protein
MVALWAVAATQTGLGFGSAEYRDVVALDEQLDIFEGSGG